MRALLLSVALLSLVPGTAVRARDEVPPTPAPKPESAPQHVTVPSLPGEANKQGTVKPEGGMPMDSEGYAVTKRYDPSAKPAQSGPKPAAKAGGAPASGPQGAPAAAVPEIPVGPAPAGKAVATGANYINVRGSVVALDAGKSVTIRLQKSGTENTYTLAPGATVGKDVAPGQVVRVRVLAAEKGKVTDKVEVVQPTTPVPAKKEGNL